MFLLLTLSRQAPTGQVDVMQLREGDLNDTFPNMGSRMYYGELIPERL